MPLPSKSSSKPASPANSAASKNVNTSRIRVLIVDDHPVVRRGLGAILAESFPAVELSEASTGAEALQVALERPLDLMILDVGLPGRGGLDLLKDLKQLKPKLPVIVVSIHAEDQVGVRALQRGASAYVTKDATNDELVKAAQRALAGGRYIQASLAEQLAFHLTGDSQSPLHEALSDREFQVMCMIAAGKTIKEIGADLSLSVKTISTYRSRILTKMNLRNNSEIMRYAYEHSLVPR